MSARAHGELSAAAELRGRGVRLGGSVVRAGAYGELAAAELRGRGVRLGGSVS